MDRTAVVARVKRVLSAKRPDDSSKSPAETQAWLRAEFIRPHYDAWKKGEELPETGTPIAACNFLNAEALAVLKRTGIRSVEDLATAPDQTLDAIKLPEMRKKREQAKHMLAATDANKVAASITARDATIAEQSAQIAEMQAMLKMLTSAQAEATSKKSKAA
jgi:hypothetical protein